MNYTVNKYIWHPSTLGNYRWLKISERKLQLVSSNLYFYQQKMLGCQCEAAQCFVYLLRKRLRTKIQCLPK